MRGKVLLVVSAILAAVVVLSAVYFSGVLPSTSGGRVIVDQLGREVRVPEDPRRIAVLDPLAAEILVALNATDRIVVRVDKATFPPQLQDIPAIRFFLGTAWNYEAVLNYSPDVVVSFAFSPDDDRITGFIQAGVPVVCISWTMSFEDVYEKIRLLGNLVNAQDRADEIIGYIRDILSTVEEGTANLSKLRAIFVRDVVEDGFMVYGKGMEEVMLELAGATNIAHSNKTKYNVGLETIIEWNPEVIVLSHRVKDGPAVILNSTNPAWESVDAFRNRMVFQLPRQYRSTSLEACLGVLLMAHWFHPDANLPRLEDVESDFYQFMYGITI